NLHPHPLAQGYLNAWAAYYARHNRVWVYSPSWRGIDLRPHALFAPCHEVDHLPDDLLIVSRAGAVPPTGTDVVWWSRHGGMRLWEARGGWLLLTDVRSEYGSEGTAAERFYWLGRKEMELTVFASRDGVARLTMELSPGPGLGDVAPSQLAMRVRAD